MRSRWRFGSQGDEENQLQRVPVFPPEIIQQAIWLYLRFTLSLRDVEDLLAERGIMVPYETVRRWVNYFGPMIAAHLRKRRPKPHTTWHLDEVYLKIAGRMVYLWRAVDAEGEVLDVLVQSTCNSPRIWHLGRNTRKDERPSRTTEWKRGRLQSKLLGLTTLDLPDEAANEAIRFLPNCPLHPEGPGNYSDGN